MASPEGKKVKEDLEENCPGNLFFGTGWNKETIVCSRAALLTRTHAGARLCFVSVVFVCLFLSVCVLVPRRLVKLLSFVPRVISSLLLLDKTKLRPCCLLSFLSCYCHCMCELDFIFVTLL